MSRPRHYGGGMVGGAAPGHPAGSRAPESFPDKALPTPGTLTSNTGGGTSPGLSNKQPVALPGFSFPPEGAYPVDQIQQATIAPGASATVVTVTVPLGLRLRTYGMGFDSVDPIGLSFLTWSLLRSGIPDRAYTNQAAVIGSVRTPSPLVFFAPDQTVITLVLSVAAASPSPYTYLARLQGYFFSEEMG